MSPDWTSTLVRVMLEASGRVFALAAAVGLLLLVARARAGAVRHAAWTGVLLAMLLMPVLPYWVPAIELPVPARARRVQAIPEAIQSAWLEPPENANQPTVSFSPEAGTAVAAAAALPATPPPARPTWPLVVLGLYLAGAMFLLVRLGVGWFAVRRIVRASERIEDGAGASGRAPSHRSAVLCESSLVATPMTVGILAPKILLPSAWREWPAKKLEAVLAHEFSHVRRRDPLVALLARLNLCLFWFHPVAWWLEKQLATTAEHACDDAGLRVMGEKRRYAEVLLDMAEAVRRAGGRFAWDGVGVHGTGLLGQRIDRVLRGDFLREVSMTRKLVVAIGCAAAVVFVIACRQQRPAPAPLKPNPRLSELRAKQKAEGEIFKVADAMTARQVADLEGLVAKNPEDLDALNKLLIFYRPIKVKIGDDWLPRCAAVIGEKECVAARRGHILWLIEHHPDNELAGSWGARIFNTPMDPLPDPAGYEQAKKLWLEKMAPRDASSAILKNAAWFFEVPDKPLDEQILLRLKSSDPKGSWSDRLGRLYYLVLVGSNASTPLNVVWTNDVAQAHGAYTQEVRRKLDESRDVDLLLGAAYYLTSSQLGDKIDFDTRALGRSCIERAIRIDPESTRARRMLVNLEQGNRNRRLSAMLRGVPKESQYAKVAEVQEAERFGLLSWAATLAWFEGDNAGYYQHDQAAQKAAWERARKYAEEILRLAPKFADRPESGPAIEAANAILGLVAFREGRETRVALEYARAAAAAPASEELAYGYNFNLTRLLGYLLMHGERDSVVDCLQQMAKTHVADRNDLLRSADEIRRGVMPTWYPQQPENAQ